MRKNPAATLMVYCPTCGNSVNEYNWTLETGAISSLKGKDSPTFIKILLECSDGKFDEWVNFKIGCPRCHEKIRVKLIPIPDKEDLMAYVDEVGEEYVNERF